MPIKSIQQRETRMITDPLPCLGEVKKGGPKSENKAGRDLDYFRFALPEDKQWLMEHIVKLYGAKPREIPGVLVTGPRLEDCFTYWLFEWGYGGKVKHKCDGEMQVAHYDEEADRVCYDRIPCIQTCVCKPSAELHFYLPELTRLTGAFGYFKLTTGSWRDIARLQQFLEYMQERGPLNDLQLIIGRREEETRVPMKDKATGEIKKRATKKWFIYMDVDPRYVMRVMAVPDPNAPRLAIASTLNELAMKELDTRAVSQVSSTLQIPAEIIDPPGDDDHQVEEAPLEFQPTNVDWTKSPASNHIPELRKRTGINPPELWAVLNEVGATADMTVAEIMRRIEGAPTLTSTKEHTAFKARTEPLSAEGFYLLVGGLILDDLDQKEVTKRQKQNLAILIRDALPFEKPTTKEVDAARHLIIGYLFDGKAGLRELTAGEALALIRALTTNNPQVLHKMAYIEIENVLAVAEALAEESPAQPASDGEEGETVDGEIISNDGEHPREPDALTALYAEWYAPSISEIEADESTRQDIVVLLKEAIIEVDPDTGRGYAHTAALNAIGFFTGQNSIKGLSCAHCEALGFWITETPDIQLGHEALACASAYEMELST